MKLAGRGRIVVWEGASLWIMAAAGPDANAERHAHHAIQVTLSLEGDFVLRTADRSCRGPVAAVAADLPHVFEASGVAAFLFIEPESNPGRAIGERLQAQAGLAQLDAEACEPAIAQLREAFASQAGDAELIALGRMLASALAGPGSAPQIDARVAAMIRHIREGLDGPITLSAVAAGVCLSPSRARHLFAATTGLPFKAFVLWQRIERAVQCYAAGRSLTEAAHEAGLSDSAHLSRTFRRTFGLAPSQLFLD